MPQNSDDSPKNVRSAKEIKQGLLKKAFAEGRGHEMIKLILWRLAEIKHHAEQDEDAIREARFMKNQPQCVRAVNTLAFHTNSATRFCMSDKSAKSQKAGDFIHPAPETVN